MCSLFTLYVVLYLVVVDTVTHFECLFEAGTFEYADRGEALQ